MEGTLTRELVSGQKLARLLVNGQPAAVVGPLREKTADLLASFYGDQWKWWALVTGVKGGTWLVRNVYRAKDYPLFLEPIDEPVVVKSSWDSPAPAKAIIRTKRRQKARV